MDPITFIAVRSMMLILAGGIAIWIIHQFIDIDYYIRYAIVGITISTSILVYYLISINTGNHHWAIIISLIISIYVFIIQEKINR